MLLPMLATFEVFASLFVSTDKKAKYEGEEVGHPPLCCQCCVHACAFFHSLLSTACFPALTRS